MQLKKSETKVKKLNKEIEQLQENELLNLKTHNLKYQEYELEIQDLKKFVENLNNSQQS